MAAAAAEDPYDLSELEDGISRAQEQLKNDLSKLRSGGRFNPEVIDNLRVRVDKASKETARLGDLAQVVPRGRMLNVMVGEKDVRAPEAGQRLEQGAGAELHFANARTGLW